MSNQAIDSNFVDEPQSSIGEFTLAPRFVQLTTRSAVEVKRTLPNRVLRTIGAWCFVDHYGPTSQEGAMKVAAHPHVGLQTVSWLFSGEVEHRDSVGSIQIISPGELNIMTAGVGIAHSELSLTKKSGQDELHGVQLWTVLPENARYGNPIFDHYDNLPVFTEGTLTIRLMVGELFGRKSDARIFSPLLGAEIDVGISTTTVIEVDPVFEYGVLMIAGELAINGNQVPLSHLHYIPAGNDTIDIVSSNGAKFLLLGGAPFDEKIVMWWNFIGRSQEEIEQMRSDWNSKGERFPQFEDRINERLVAPELPRIRMLPRGNGDWVKKNA